jgi:hypothetical protein
MRRAILPSSVMFDQLWRFWWWMSHLAVQEPLALASVVLGGATLVIVLVQLYVMTRQTRLASKQLEIADTQLEIMRRQDEILAADRARRACLEVVVLANHGDSIVELQIKNSGNRTAHSFYWHLAIPVDIMEENQVWRENEALLCTDTLPIEGRACRHFRGYQPEPLFPTRMTPIASFGIKPSAHREAQLVFWSTICEDGKNPEGETNMCRSIIEVGA